MFCDSNEYKNINIIAQIDELIKKESSCFKRILYNNEVFETLNKMIGYSLDIDNGIRDISTVDELKQILLLFCHEKNDPDEFIDEGTFAQRYLMEQVVLRV